VVDTAKSSAMKAHRRGIGDFPVQPAPRRDRRRFVRITKLKRETALRAARALCLGQSGCAICSSDRTVPKSLGHTARIRIRRNEKATVKDIVSMILTMIRSAVKPQPVAQAQKNMIKP